MSLNQKSFKYQIEMEYDLYWTKNKCIPRHFRRPLHFNHTLPNLKAVIGWNKCCSRNNNADPGICPTLSLLWEIQPLFRSDPTWIEWWWDDECQCPSSLRNFKTKITFSFANIKCWQQMQDLGCSIIQCKPFVLFGKDRQHPKTDFASGDTLHSLTEGLHYFNGTKCH